LEESNEIVLGAKREERIEQEDEDDVCLSGAENVSKGCVLEDGETSSM
jgi:hypothetical protein